MPIPRESIPASRDRAHQERISSAGTKVTDDNGTVRFMTVYPGGYEGRAIHIHVKVRTFEGAQETFELTSQLYLPNSVNEQVHTLPPYRDHGPVDMTNEEDGIQRGID